MIYIPYIVFLRHKGTDLMPFQTNQIAFNFKIKCDVYLSRLLIVYKRQASMIYLDYSLDIILHVHT